MKATKSPGVRWILIVVVLVCMTPELTEIVYQFFSGEQEEVLRDAKLSLARETDLRAASQRALFEGVRHTLGTVAPTAYSLREDSEACDAYLQQAGRHLLEYGALAFADIDGTVRCRSRAAVPAANVANRQFFRDAVRSRRFSVGEYDSGDDLASPTLAFSLPVYAGSRLVGVQYAVLELQSLQREFQANAAVPQNMTLVTMDANGVVLASAGAAPLKAGELAPGFLARAVRTSNFSRGRSIDERGSEWLYDLTMVSPPGAGAVVMASMLRSERTDTETARHLLVSLSLLVGITLVISLLAWHIGERLIASPIRRLAAKVKALEEGHGQPDAPAANRLQVREVAHVERSIDALAATLAARSLQRDQAMAALADSERRYRSQFESSPQPMWVFDQNSLAFLEVNDAAVGHYGYTRDEFLRMTLKDIRPPEDIPELQSVLSGSLARPQNDSAARHRTKSGAVIHVEVAAHAVAWNGRPARMVIVYDVTSRVLAEQAWAGLSSTLEAQVHQRTAELEVANKELEAFSYSVSHDLRNPLAAIRAFCAVLTKRYGESMPAEALEYVEKIAGGATHMNTLIADLLALSRAAREPIHLQMTNLAEVAAEVVEEWRVRLPAHQVAVTIDETLPAYCDPRLMRIVFENLIGNVWKFTARSDRPTLRIALESTPQSPTTIVVADNGPGFDPAKSDRLFKPFQRLHTAGEFEGTGVGLAIVYSVIRRHNGHVWAESEPGKGARFYIALPTTGASHAAGFDAQGRRSDLRGTA